MRRLGLALVLASLLTAAMAGAASAKGNATCSDLFEGNPHGYHVIADYVTGIGTELLGGPGIDWPPKGINAAGGAAVHGGPFHGGHLPPGASFCIEQAKSGGR